METEEEAPALVEAWAAAGRPQAARATVAAEPAEPQAARATVAAEPAEPQAVLASKPALELRGAEGATASSSPYVTPNALGPWRRREGDAAAFS